MYILKHSQYAKSDKGASNRMQDLQCHVFGDLYSKVDHWVIDIQIAYLREHWLLSADNPELY